LICGIVPLSSTLRFNNIALAPLVRQAEQGRNAAILFQRIILHTPALRNISHIALANMGSRVILNSIASSVNLVIVAKMRGAVVQALAIIHLRFFKNFIGNIGAICQNHD
jgi:hypothetical protein